MIMMMVVSLRRLASVAVVFSICIPKTGSQETKMGDNPSSPMLEELVSSMNAMKTKQDLDALKLESKVEAIEKKHSEEMTELQGKLKKQQEVIDGIMRERRSKRLYDTYHRIGYSGKYVGFFAMSTTNQQLSNNEVIEFKDVRYNQRNHYSGSTSKFTCPDNGVYVFFVTIMSAGGSRNTYVRWRIVRNRDTLTEGHTGYGSTHNMLNPTWGSAVTGSQMVIDRCDAGNHVWVAAHVVSGESNKQQTYHGYTSFAGFKLS